MLEYWFTRFYAVIWTACCTVFLQGLGHSDRFKDCLLRSIHMACTERPRERRRRCANLRHTLLSCSAVQLFSFQYGRPLCVLPLRLSYSPWFRAWGTAVDIFKIRRTQALPIFLDGPSPQAPNIKGAKGLVQLGTLNINRASLMSMQSNQRSCDQTRLNAGG